MEIYRKTQKEMGRNDRPRCKRNTETNVTGEGQREIAIDGEENRDRLGLG